MAELAEIMTYLERLAPPALAEDYDNVGLLIGDEHAEVTKVLISLDTDESVAREAAELGAQLVLSHHPLIFRPAKNIIKQSGFGRTVYTLIQNNISLYAMHTNFDSVSGGLGDYFLAQICPQKAFGCMEGEFPNGIGRIAELKDNIPLAVLLEKIKQNFGMEQIRYVGSENTPVRKIAVCNGGGADFTDTAAQMGADVYISGDFKYHHARFAYENRLCLVEIPHYEAEIIFSRYLRERLNKEFDRGIEFIVSEKNRNPWNIK